MQVAAMRYTNQRPTSAPDGEGDKNVHPLVDLCSFAKFEKDRGKKKKKKRKEYVNIHDGSGLTGGPWHIPIR
jgi:hypothetical protein